MALVAACTALLTVAGVALNVLGTQAAPIRAAPAPSVGPARPAEEPPMVRPAAAAGADGHLAALPFTFRAESFDLLELAEEDLPYAREHVWELDRGGLLDDENVRVVEMNGSLHDHPVAQAQYGLLLLSSHRLTGDEVFLDRARRQADRLVDRAVRVGDALYFPYPFDFPRHSDEHDVMRAPWYSAMAQGQALSLFVRLHELTGDEAYRTAADGAYRSFLRTRERATRDGGPWTVFVNDDGYLWLEEYSRTDHPPDLTFNGLAFGLYGLYDYWRLTHDPAARLLIEGSLTTIDWAIERVRVPGEVSRYCLAHEVQDEAYHRTHIAQLGQLHELTGDDRFARWAELLSADQAP